MHPTLPSLLFLLAATCSAQYTNGTCITPGTYCAGSSGTTNIVIHCPSAGAPAQGFSNCNDNLAGTCGGVCQFAPCVQTCPNTGDGHCTACGAIRPNGTVIECGEDGNVVARRFRA